MSCDGSSTIMFVQHLCIFATVILGALAQFNPTLSVDSCTKSVLEITLTDAADNGIVYIQGQDTACRQFTTSGVSTHSIDFNACNIQWEETFKIVVQKNQYYQTGADKQIPVMCIADLADLSVTSGFNATCPADIELFPVIDRTTQGVLQAQFGAFRTTSLSGAPVSMVFTCTLQVCLGACSATTCADGSSSYGRKKRSLTKRQAPTDDNAVEDITLGSSLRIATDEIIIEGGPGDTSELCMNQGLFIVVVLLLTGGLIAASIAAVIIYRKLQEKTEIFNKLNGSMSIPVA
ncbi:hypothetical protein ACF0H5_020135 [Mactra antiquata]